MFKKLSYISFLLLFCLVYISCKKEKTQLIPAEVESYVTSFFQDARNHGLNIYLEDYELTIRFAALDGPDGTCSSKNNIIELDSFTWENMSATRKKWLIYHELGHCILDRLHDNGVFQNGECKSIMRGDWQDTDCTTNFISTLWEDYYIQEMFTRENDLPGWYNLSAVLKVPDSFSYNSLTLDSMLFENRLTIENIPIQSEDNFQICMIYEDWLTSDNCIRLYWDNKGLILCSTTGFGIDRKAEGVPSQKQGYYSKRINIDFQSITSLCILKEDNLYHFFADGALIHVMDYETWETNEKVFTNNLDGPVNLSLTMFNFD